MAKTKFDLGRSLQVGQINHAQNANLKIAFLYCGLFIALCKLSKASAFCFCIFLRSENIMDASDVLFTKAVAKNAIPDRPTLNEVASNLGHNPVNRTQVFMYTIMTLCSCV